MKTAVPSHRGSYGLDAPYLLAVPLILVVVAAVQGAMTGSPWPFVGGAVVIVCTGFGLYASTRGKFAVWAEVLDLLDLKGDEQILDLGCGRGAVLMLAAQHLTSGRATGIDLWRKADQPGNAAERTRRNAVADGVSDRVELVTGDIAALPFAGDSFDVILSSLVLHNLTRRSQERAISEAVRVLRPGGACWWPTWEASDAIAGRCAPWAWRMSPCAISAGGCGGAGPGWPPG